MDRSGTRPGRPAGLARNRVALAGAGALTLLATALLPLGRSAAEPPLTWVDSPMRPDPRSLDDGFAHYVVSFGAGREATGGPGADEAPAGAAPAPGTVVRRVPVAEAGRDVDAATLRSLAGQGRVLGLGRDDAGRLVASVEVAPGPAPAAGGPEAEAFGPAPGPGPDPQAEAVQAVEGTRAVTAVGGGHYAVTTSAPRSAYEALPGAEVFEDVVAGVFADPYLDSQWHLRNTGGAVSGLAGVAGADVGALEAWAVSEGEGAVVAVVDTGMQTTHPDLAAGLWRNPGETCGNRVDDDANGYVDDCEGWDFYNNDATPYDTGTNALGQTIDNRHATHIAGIVAAGRDNGVGVAGLAPRARVMPLKISDTGSMYLSAAAAAIRYAADNGADVVNCSFGTRSGVPLSAIGWFQDAVRYAASRGVLVVAAAGNDARNIDADPTWPASLPDDGVLTVAASTNADTRASFSNWGATSVDLAAPGWSIVSTLPDSGYGGMHGTSMAAPLAAAAAALVRSVQPDLDVAGLKAVLMSGSAEAPAFAGLTVSGRRLDAGLLLGPAPVEPVTFSFDGLDAVVEGEPASAAVTAAVAAGEVTGDVAYRATLLTAVDGRPYGVSGAEVATAEGTVVTDEEAAVPLSPAGGWPAGLASRSLPFGVTLPAGQYVLVAEAYAPGDDTTVGRPWAAFFSVVAPGLPSPPTTVVPVPTTLPGGGGTAPTTTLPGGGGTPPTTSGPAAPPTLPPGGGTPPSTSGGTAPTTAPPGGGSGPGATTPPTTAPPGGGTPPTTSPPPGGTPPTTRATAPPPSATTTTAPAATPPTTSAGPPPVTLPPPPPPATDGNLTVTSVSPRSGSTGGGDRLTITGSGFGPTMHVLFGSTPGAVVGVVSGTQLLVTTPNRAEAGTVDVRVSTAHDSVVLARAFTYLAPGTPLVGTPPTTAPGGGTAPTTPPPGGGGPPTPTTTSPPAGGTPTTPTTTSPPAGGTPTTTAPGTPTTTTVPAPVNPLRFRFGSATTARGSLVLRPLAGPSLLDAYPPSGWAARACRAATCAGTRL